MNNAFIIRRATPNGVNYWAWNSNTKSPHWSEDRSMAVEWPQWYYAEKVARTIGGNVEAR